MRQAGSHWIRIPKLLRFTSEKLRVTLSGCCVLQGLKLAEPDPLCRFVPRKMPVSGPKTLVIVGVCSLLPAQVVPFCAYVEIGASAQVVD